jgi:hypothetical protein
LHHWILHFISFPETSYLQFLDLRFERYETYKFVDIWIQFETI